MPEVDSGLALHCLEDLGKRVCPIMTQRAAALTPSAACDGLSIRDTLNEFLVQACVDMLVNEGSTKAKRIKKWHVAYGQAQALAYTISLMDNPYRPDWPARLEEARMEASKR